MGKRCQVCDGPVVNGRCKYCGMPYRNDAVMYHLNEDRSEHYRHASEKVRKEIIKYCYKELKKYAEASETSETSASK